MTDIYTCPRCGVLFSNAVALSIHVAEHRIANAAYDVTAKITMARQSLFDVPQGNDILDRRRPGRDTRSVFDRQEEQNMAIRQQLQRLSLTTIDFDDAIEMSMLAENLRVTYARHGLASPVWLDDSIRGLSRHITDRMKDAAEMELRELDQQDAADMSKDEKRAQRAARRTELKAKLGQGEAVGAKA